MKGKMAAIIAGTLLAITTGASLPASATVSNTNSQHSMGGQQSTLPLTTKGNTVSGQSTIATPSNNKTNKWHLEQKGATLNQLTPVEQQNFNKFQNAINQGLSPKQAAQKVTNAKFTKVKGTKNQYSMHLSEKASATFLVNNKNHVVNLLQVGGHTQQMKTSAHR